MTMNEPSLSVTGVTASQAKRAIRWLANRSLLAFYHRGELRAFPFKHGREWTYNVLHKALKETRR